MLDKRVVIITGGAGNMGTVTARKYTDMGDAVVLVDMDTAKGEARANEFCAAGKDVIFLRADISKEEQCIALVEKVMEVYGRIDVLCNNAGRMSFCRDFLTMDISEFTGILNVNLVAMFTLTKLVAKKMIECGTKNGVIINTGSTAGYLHDENGLAYSVSKAGVHSLTKCTARELAPKGIRVVAIVPGCVNGIMRNSSMNPKDFSELCELHMRNRVLNPEEIANVSYFLSTPEASGINGTMVRVDDGYTSFKMHTMLLDNKE